MSDIKKSPANQEFGTSLAERIAEYEVRMRQAEAAVSEARKNLALSHRAMAEVLMGRAEDFEFRAAAGAGAFDYDQAQRSTWVELEIRAGNSIRYHQELYEDSLDLLAELMPAHAANLRRLPERMLELAVLVGAIKLAEPEVDDSGKPVEPEPHGGEGAPDHELEALRAKMREAVFDEAIDKLGNPEKTP
jgi:hypothetical protein